jgi:hypothetical protein
MIEPDERLLYRRDGGNLWQRRARQHDHRKLKRSTATGLISIAFRRGKANRGMLPTIARKRHAPAPR